MNNSKPKRQFKKMLQLLRNKRKENRINPNLQKSNKKRKIKLTAKDQLPLMSSSWKNNPLNRRNSTNNSNKTRS